MSLHSYARIAALLLLLPAASFASAARAGDRAEAEIGCLALTIYYEARGESETGKRAVGYVVMNRARSGAFPADVCGVVRQGGERRHRCQFSWWCDGLSDRPRDRQALRQSLSLAQAIYNGCVPDPTRGALWFHATRVKPAWSKTSGPGKRIGRHVFYRGAPSIETAAATNVRWSKSEKIPPAECVPAAKPARNLLAASRS
jgi:spore germination cell wall hydrolase CwlJ-like protein